MKILFDAKLMRPACVLLQAVAGCSPTIADQFNGESWLVYPTEDMKLYEVTPEQLQILVRKVNDTINKPLR